MPKLPLPLRNYENLMLLAKQRLMFIDAFQNEKIDFLKAELIAVQLRKIIEGVAYGCVSVCQLGGANLSDELLKTYDASVIFEALKKIELSFVPTACSLKITARETIEDWSISKKDVPRSAQLNSASDYVKAYKKLHRYAHEFHPQHRHHLLYNDGLARAIGILGPIKTKITNSLWQHFIPFGERALVVDFGKKDALKPEIFVFRRSDGDLAWPLLFAVT